MQEVAVGDEAGEPAKKKQKTATSLNVCYSKIARNPCVSRPKLISNDF